MVVASATPSDVRFAVALYTQAEAARYVDMPASTFRTWAQGYERRGEDRPTVKGVSLITYIPAPRPSEPSVPFIGLAEAMFLSALRKAGVPL